MKTPNPYVHIWGLYKDRGGNIWKAVQDFKFGRWLLYDTVRKRTMETTRAHIIDCMEYVGQGESDYVDM